MDWDGVVRTLGPRLMRYFVSRYPKEQAADLVQEVLLRLVRRYRQGAIDPSRGDVIMFAFGIAKNLMLEDRKVARTSLRLIEKNETASVSSNELDPSQLAEKSESAAMLRRAISMLNNSEQQVLMLYMDDDLSLPEIGTILKMPTGTVKSHLHRAREHLKTYLATNKRDHHER